MMMGTTMMAEPHIFDEDTSQLLTLQEAMDMLKVSRATLYRYHDEGWIDMLSMGGTRRVTLASVHRYFNKRIKERARVTGRKPGRPLAYDQDK